MEKQKARRSIYAHRYISVSLLHLPFLFRLGLPNPVRIGTRAPAVPHTPGLHHEKRKKKGALTHPSPPLCGGPRVGGARGQGQDVDMRRRNTCGSLLSPFLHHHHRRRRRRRPDATSNATRTKQRQAGVITALSSPFSFRCFFLIPLPCPIFEILSISLDGGDPSHDALLLVIPASPVYQCVRLGLYVHIIKLPGYTVPMVKHLIGPRALVPCAFFLLSPLREAFENVHQWFLPRSARRRNEANVGYRRLTPASARVRRDDSRRGAAPSDRVKEVSSSNEKALKKN